MGAQAAWASLRFARAPVSYGPPRRLVLGPAVRFVPGPAEYLDEAGVFVLADGRLVNLSAAEGHPAMVMDMSFANQALAAEYMVKHHRTLKPSVYVVPEKIDAAIAALKLKSMGTAIDTLTPEQKKYLASWEMGT